MTAALSQETAATASPASLRAVPRAMWVALGALSLVTAGMAGALVMRAVDSPAAPVAAEAGLPKVAAMVESPGGPLAGQFVSPGPAAQEVPAPVAPRAAVPVAAAPATRPTARPAAAPAAAVARAPAQPAWNPPLETTRAAVCSNCGTVEAVQAVQEPGQGSGLGAVGGAVLGGLLGNQVGGGNGRKVMTVVGAAGGAFAGHEVEKRVRANAAYDLRVRMEDGSLRTFRRAEPMTVGTRVLAEGNTVRVVQGTTAPAAPRPIYTTQSVGYGG